MQKSEDSGDDGRKVGLVLRPDSFAERLSDVPLDELAARGIAGIIVDLDNTLLGYALHEPAPEDAAWIAAALGRGFRVALLSNNFTDRVTRIGAALGVPTVPNALKPLPHGFLRALRLLGTPRRATVVVGDQLFTDVLGAKLCGMRAVLTRPIEARDFAATRILRFFERIVLGPGRRRA